jgi:hypothetical protein
MADDASNQVNLAAKFGGKIRGLSSANKALVDENARLKEQVATQSTKIAELEKQVSNPAADRKRVAELEGQIRTDKHRAAFRTQAIAAGMNESAVDDVFRLSEYKAELDDHDPDAFQSIIDDAKTKRPYVFGKAEASKPDDKKTQQKPIPGGDRGNHNRGDGITTFSKSDLADPKVVLSPGYRKRVASAVRDGSARFVD